MVKTLDLPLCATAVVVREMLFRAARCIGVCFMLVANQHLRIVHPIPGSSRRYGALNPHISNLFVSSQRVVTSTRIAIFISTSGGRDCTNRRWLALKPQRFFDVLSLVAEPDAQEAPQAPCRAGAVKAKHVEPLSVAWLEVMLTMAAAARVQYFRRRYRRDRRPDLSGPRQRSHRSATRSAPQAPAS
jgi:hypothetical protein